MVYMKIVIHKIKLNTALSAHLLEGETTSGNEVKEVQENDVTAF